VVESLIGATGSKKHCSKWLAPRPPERIGLEEGVTYYAQKQTDHWPNENATDRARIDNAEARVAHEANGWKGQDVDGA
jgi:hypothetical protein